MVHQSPTHLLEFLKIQYRQCNYRVNFFMKEINSEIENSTSSVPNSDQNKSDESLEPVKECSPTNRFRPRLLEKSNSEDQEKCGLAMNDVLSERSQIKSSESIDEQVFQEKLAYLVATDSTTTGGANRSIGTKIIDSIKRRLSYPSSNKGGNNDTNENDGVDGTVVAKTRDNVDEEARSKSTHTTTLELTPTEKERLRRQIDFYHRHYLEHNSQLKRQQHTLPISEENTEWSAMSIEQKRRVFRISQISKEKLKNLMSGGSSTRIQRDRSANVTINRHDSSNFSSSYSFNSASFKQRSNGTVHRVANSTKQYKASNHAASRKNS